MTSQQRREFYLKAKDIVLVDFDGTLCSWSYPAMGAPEEGAREFMKALTRWGLKPVVWSSRLSPQFNTVEEVADAAAKIMSWLEKHDIPFSGIDGGVFGKRLCLAYVDDRAVAYTGHWGTVMRRIERLREQEKERQKGGKP